MKIPLPAPTDRVPSDGGPAEANSGPQRRRTVATAVPQYMTRVI